MGSRQDVWGSQKADGVAELKNLTIAASHGAPHGITSWSLELFASLFA
jgi:hypothetical protein